MITALNSLLVAVVLRDWETAVPLAGYVTLNKSFNLAGPQFPHLYN